MLRKTLIALTAVGALGVSSAAIAAQGGHGGGGGAPSFSGAGGSGGSLGMSSRGSVGSNLSFSRTMGTNRTISTNRISTLHSNTNFTTFHNRRFHHRNAFFFGGVGVGFAGGYYDSCWRLVPTYWGGWQRVWVCDYPYYGGYGDYWGY